MPASQPLVPLSNPEAGQLAAAGAPGEARSGVAVLRVRSTALGAWVSVCRWTASQQRECPLPAGTARAPAITL